MQETGASFRARWAAVNAVQDEELRSLSTEDRFEQLLELFDLRDFVNADPKAEKELAAVRRRWAKIRRLYLASG